MSMTPTLQCFKGRYLVTAWIVSWLFFPVNLIMALFDHPPEWYWWDLGYYIPSQLFLGAVLVLVGICARLDVRAFFGPLPDAAATKQLVLLFVALWVLTDALNFITFYPLSLILPDFVTWWFIDLPPAVYTDGAAFPVVPNALSIINLVILAPIIEETLFRGYLLHRWAHKWGQLRGVVLSSTVFGIAHPDILPAILFGIAMCVVRLRTGSLLGPILLHAGWNGLYWAWTYHDLVTKGSDYRYTLTEFQASWPLGLVSVVLSLAFLYAFSMRRRERDGAVFSGILKRPDERD